jgi:dihydrofolate reductase
MNPYRKIVLFIAMSIDGYIADKKGNIDFLKTMELEGQDYGYSKFIDSIDTVILGRKTYDKVISMGYEYPHQGKDVYIITKSQKPKVGTFQYYSGNIEELILNLKKSPGKNIYCDGGAMIVNLFLQNHWIDEMILSIVPVILGDGIRLFDSHIPLETWELLETKDYNTGLVQLHYQKL